MVAIIDSRVSKTVVRNLSYYCSDILLFTSQGITYESISCHPDIFIYCGDNNSNIIAPNTPNLVSYFFKKYNITFSFGNSNVGNSLKQSTLYNCLSNTEYFFHKENYSDLVIKQQTTNKLYIMLPQAYTACSLISLDVNNYITSDKGIEKQLLRQGFNCFYFEPFDILIKEHKHGFIGGTCGICKNKIFFIGNIDKHISGQNLRNYIENLDFEIICLSEDFLYDGGKILFFE